MRGEEGFMKTVLYVNCYASPVSMRFLDGVSRYAHKAKWNMQVVDKVSDAESIAGMAVREFLSMGIGNFAFCGYEGVYPWTGRRERSFRRRWNAVPTGFYDSLHDQNRNVTINNP